MTGYASFRVAILSGRRRFAWRPVRLEDGRTAFLRFVHELSPVCGIVPKYGGRTVTYTDRIPHCRPALRDRIAISLIRMERSMKVLVARLVIAWIVAVEFVTLGLGFWFGFHPALDGFPISPRADLYYPGQFLTWYAVLHPADHWYLTYGLAACLLLAAVLASVGTIERFKMMRRGDGPSRIATPREVRSRFR